MKITLLLREAETLLASVSTSSRLDAELLLQQILGVEKAFFYSHPDQELSPEQYNRWLILLKRRQQGEPIAYIRGMQAFWDAEFIVSPQVLIPRPETELLIELALKKLPHDQPLTILDLGCGSGAIALSLKKACSQWRLVGIDQSKEALAVAEQNAKRLGLTVDWRCGEWFAPANEEKFDAIISNPPYLAEDDPHLQQGDLRFEPRSALVAGKTGMEALEFIGRNATGYLKGGGLLALEHGFTQGIAVRKLLMAENFIEVETLPDLAGHERVSFGTRAAQFQ